MLLPGFPVHSSHPFSKSITLNKYNFVEIAKYLKTLKENYISPQIINLQGSAVIFKTLETSPASLTSAASATSLASTASKAQFPHKTS